MQDEYTENRAGERLRASIEGRGWTLAAFSRASGVPYRSIQDYVSGKSKPGFDQLAKFAERGLDLAYILTGKSINNEESPLPDSMSYGDFSFGRRPYRDSDQEEIMKKVEDGFSLRDWISIWSLSEDSILPAASIDMDEKRRQGVVVFVACGIAIELVERMRALGWLAR